MSRSEKTDITAITPVQMEAQAYDLARAKKWRAATQLLLKAARAEPHNIGRWTQIARWQRENREPRMAAQTLLRAIRANTAPPSKGERQPKLEPPDWVALYAALLELQLEQQDWIGCLETCDNILKTTPRHHFALEVLATAQLHTGQIGEAAAAMKVLLQISPRDPLHRLKYATLLQLQGQNGAALQEFARVVAAYPDAPFANDARDAIELLDTMQIQQILMRATEHELFRLELRRSFDETLREHGFHLSDNGRESLRHMVDEGRGEADLPPRLH